MKEIELKFLDIDKEEMAARLIALGAKKEFDSVAESIIFKGEGFDPGDQSKKYLRLRKVNSKCFLTYKGPREDHHMKIREEIEAEVGDFEEVRKILAKIGFKERSCYDKKRAHFSLGKVHFEIDEYEGIPPFLEIETDSVEMMEKICRDLGLDMKKGTNQVITEAYPGIFKN